MNTEKKERIIDSILIFIIFTTIVMLLNFTNSSIGCDNIWEFHIYQKVANGDLLYSEISTVVTPITFWLGGLFIKIFGNYLRSVYIYTGFVWGIIATLFYNIIYEGIKKKNTLQFLVIMIYILVMAWVLFAPGYNLVAIMWIFFAILFEIKCEKLKEVKTESKKINLYNYMIGIFLGLAFFTKQNIGAFGVIATGLISIINSVYFKKKNPIKEILIKSGGFLTVLSLMVIYFLVTDTFLDFWGYCILGLFEFGSRNLRFGLPIKYFIPLIIVVVSVLINFSKECNEKIKCKNSFILTIYTVTMSLVIYPLANEYHACLGILLLPILIMFLIDDMKLNGELNSIVSVIMMTIFVLNLCLTCMGGDTANDFCSEKGVILADFVSIIAFLMIIIIAIHFFTKKDLILKPIMFVFLIAFCIFGTNIYVCYKINTGSNEIIKIYDGLCIDNDILDKIERTITFIQEKEKSGREVIPISFNASYYTAALGRNNYKYDLMLYGSLGKDGVEGVIEELSNLDEDVLLLKEKDIFHQEPTEVDEYVKANYKPIDYIENSILYEKIK